MKNIKIIIVLFLICLTCGCDFKKTNLDNAKIYATIYPTEFIIDYLYGDNGTIESIYPEGVNFNNYNLDLTDKQLDTLAESDLFVYVGLGKELDVAKSLINKNDKLKIIDSTSGINYNYNINELWLAPNNFLMLTKNIRSSLNEYLDNTLKEEEVNKKYDELYEKVSWIDAELRNVAKEAKENGNNTLVVSSNLFKYLESYGFNVVSIEEIANSKSENAINDLKNKFKNSKYKTIVKLNSEKNSELVDSLVKNQKATLVEINDLVTNEDPASDYVSMQYENIAVLRNIFTD